MTTLYIELIYNFFLHHFLPILFTNIMSYNLWRFSASFRIILVKYYKWRINILRPYRVSLDSYVEGVKVRLNPRVNRAKCNARLVEFSSTTVELHLSELVTRDNSRYSYARSTFALLLLLLAHISGSRVRIRAWTQLTIIQRH